MATDMPDPDAEMERLEAITPQIEEIRRTFGTPSISCGVLHRGEVIFRYSDGFANVEKRRYADDNTVYPVASCTKAFVSATCAILVHEGTLSWETPVSSYLPDFETPQNPEVGRRATLVDLCSHTTGLAPMDHVAVGFFERCYNNGHDQVRISASLPSVHEFRSQFLYNNHMYGVVGEAIAKMCGKSTGAVMKEKIFEPLGMERTCTSPIDYPEDDNIATGYAVLDDGSAFRLEEPELRDGSTNAGAGCVRSTVNDMLAWARFVMEAEARQSGQPLDHTASTPKKNGLLPGMASTRASQVPITTEDPSTGENSYGMGWFRHTIPSDLLGFTSPNFPLLRDPPIIGKESPARLTICHYGALGGFLVSFYTFPETYSAIVVLGNSSSSRGDPTDLIAQSICQELFDMKPRVNFGSVATQATATSKLVWPTLVREWVLGRGQGPGRALPSVADFVGRYENRGLALQLHVHPNPERRKRHSPSWRARNPELLVFSVNGQQCQKLRHFRADTWTFLANSRDDAVRKGMERFMTLPSLLLAFTRDSDGRVSGLEWNLNGEGSDGPATGGGDQLQPVRLERVG
ncbi:beta-lactamase/transpeptidase-like protein [Cercophora newfieldiana]|uniref:Beta-lactamase/transpeptidase-like protein n=1 Tax=Cercophora newfieldiana TaxID=92897 RepID=A0AA40CLW2_9PEZI|nr:beta-lactamase/transpeptidase-like protein [Cercophora newfieldiana]